MSIENNKQLDNIAQPFLATASFVEFMSNPDPYVRSVMFAVCMYYGLMPVADRVYKKAVGNNEGKYQKPL